MALACAAGAVGVVLVLVGAPCVFHKDSPMIYKREDYFEENEGDQRFPVKHVEVLVPIDGSPAQFVGQVTIGLSTPLGLQQIPVTFEIQARDVREAFQ
jgi:hypothetical protein